jgi:transcriptional regulator with PAS, ATPase and Fis domain
VRGVPVQTIDDVSSALDEGGAMPAIVMIATGTQPAALAIPPPAELGRRIAAGEVSHEVADERMSRDHAVVTWERGMWRIRDLDSRNGTFVDGERISGEVRRGGDPILRLGHTLFLLLADGRGHPAPEGEHVVGPELARAYDQVRRHAGSDTLLVHGESGSGKELAARLYHDAGPRRAGPFVAVNCAAIPEGVAERLLFGAKKGAFSGAIEALGHFQMASGGTLFLDEIADLDAAVQAKLLRAVETREVVPVGATTGTPLELGIVAASHRELRAAIAERRFRDDLYYRLARVTVHLPPLRERKVDLARLVQREVATAEGALSPHPKLIEACCLRPWPGNIRELRAAVRRAAAAALAAGRDVVRADDLAATDGLPVGSPTADTAVDRPLTPAELGKDAVVAALARANGVVSVAARNLGLHRTQLYRLMVKHGIARDD